MMRLCAVRYCLGRRTYVTWECANWLISTWAQIPERAKAIIKRDIEEEFARDDRIRAMFPKGGAGSLNAQPTYYPLGDDCDRKEWERVRKLWVEG